MFLGARSVLATAVAVGLRAPGQRFGMFGRWTGLRALRAGQRAGLGLVLTPVNIVRYWEFPFVLRNLSPRAQSCLDVGSPRLFALYVASRRRTAVRIINPDPTDAASTIALADALGLDNVSVEPLGVSGLAGDPRRYDAVWSISVIEHIPGDGDREAMALMYASLAPGGRLLVTVPVDRSSWTEYRDVDTYGLGLPRAPEGYFFQRWYDEAAIHERLLGPLGEPGSTARVEWFGERRAGRFAAYEQDWMRRGHARTVGDPVEIARGYRPFERWSEMPGQGVCGVVISKPA